MRGEEEEEVEYEEEEVLQAREKRNPQICRAASAKKSNKVI